MNDSIEQPIAVEIPEVDLPVELAPVSGGEFLMGSEDRVAEADEKPAHLAVLDSYAVSRYPVTIAQFAAFLRAQGACERDGRIWITDQETESQLAVTEDGRCTPAPEMERHPVTGVSWWGAMAFCEWLEELAGRPGFTLPSEAQWEFAARGPEGWVYPWGNEWDAQKTISNDHFDSRSDDTAHASGSAPVDSCPEGASAFGLEGMAGNVWEWTRDWYSDTFYERSPQENPLNGEPTLHRSIRGGCWSSGRHALRATCRGCFDPGLTRGTLGFRCALLSED